MDSKLSKVVATIIIASMLIAFSPAFAAQPQEPHAADSMWVEPSVNSFGTDAYSVGYKFNVTIWLNMTEDVLGYQVKMFFNASQLSVTKAGFTAVATSEYFQGTVPVVCGPVIDNVAGYALFGETLLAPAKIPGPKCASLVWVEFQIIAAPPMGGSLSSVLHINHDESFVANPSPPPDYWPINKYDATYTYTWVAPPKPWLAVDPSYVEF